MQINYRLEGTDNNSKDIATKVIDMHRMGYEVDFGEVTGGLSCLQTGAIFGWNELLIAEIGAYIGVSLPNTAIIYAVETADGIRGLFLNRCKVLSKVLKTTH
jgi:hypothetical protein